MKIHLRQFLLLKQITLLAVPVIVLLAIVFYFFLPVHPSATVEDKAVSQPKTVSNIIPKAKPAPLAKVRVITPVRVSDEPFRGFYPVPTEDKEEDEGQDESAALDSEKKDGEAPCEELSTPAQRQEKTNKGHVKDKRVDQSELPAKRPSASAQGGSADKWEVQTI